MEPAREAFIPVLMSEAQRRAVAGLAPELAARLFLDEPRPKKIHLPPAELATLVAQIRDAEKRREVRGSVRASLRHAEHALQQAARKFETSRYVYRVRVELCDVKPPIWRELLVPDFSFDELHYAIQGAMGWTNSHLYEFVVGKHRIGDPRLLDSGFEKFEGEDSTERMLGEVVPKKLGRCRFEYVYDFGDSWHHEVQVLGREDAQPKTKYPLCVAGARACPPEDVGGIWGYEEFLSALRDPKHERHREFREWLGRRFDPEAFDAAKATRYMRRFPRWS